jgi:hypothetical protein
LKPTRLFILTLMAMIAFAGNSLLCRAALKQTNIDAASFTFVRIFSGAAALWLIIKIRNTSAVATAHGNWPSAFALFAYAAAFSFAYVDLAAGTGALLLFGAVQATMILWGFRQGERLHAIQFVRAVVSWSFRSTGYGFDLDAECGRGLGHLFAARKAKWQRSCGHGGQFSARRSVRCDCQYRFASLDAT